MFKNCTFLHLTFIKIIIPNNMMEKGESLGESTATGHTIASKLKHAISLLTQ